MGNGCHHAVNFTPWQHPAMRSGVVTCCSWFSKRYVQGIRSPNASEEKNSHFHFRPLLCSLTPPLLGDGESRGYVTCFSWF